MWTFILDLETNRCSQDTTHLEYETMGRMSWTMIKSIITERIFVTSIEWCCTYKNNLIYGQSSENISGI